MDFDAWEPVYEAVLADFGFPREADERARDLLADLLTGETLAPADLEFAGAAVAIAGGGPSLRAELDRARRADAVVAASDAAAVLRAVEYPEDPIQWTDEDREIGRASCRERVCLYV